MLSEPQTGRIQYVGVIGAKQVREAMNFGSNYTPCAECLYK